MYWRRTCKPVRDTVAKVTEERWRLPTKAEWAKAAYGTDERLYLWGNTWDEAWANTNKSGNGRTTPIGSYPNGASSYGVQDMAGNVHEWCNSLSPFYPHINPEDMNAGVQRYSLGGAWLSECWNTDAKHHMRFWPETSAIANGFRLVRGGTADVLQQGMGWLRMHGYST
jgi:formylglycine-generating enzyme required for sulfatase activity